MLYNFIVQYLLMKRDYLSMKLQMFLMKQEEKNEAMRKRANNQLKSVIKKKEDNDNNIINMDDIYDGFDTEKKEKYNKYSGRIDYLKTRLDEIEDGYMKINSDAPYIIAT